MRYVVAGGTGATGSVLLPLLAEQVGARAVTCLVRASSDTRLPEALGIRTHCCDLADPASYRDALGPETTYIGIVAVKTPFFPETLAMLRARGVRRAVFLSSTLVFSHFTQNGEKFRANEENIRRSGITYTILRASMIYGSTPGKNSIQALVRTLNRWPIYPLFGAGENLMQPVHAEDLCRGILAALRVRRAENAEFNLAGPTPMPYRELIRTTAEALGRPVWILPVNLSAATAAVKVLQRLPGFPLNERHLRRLREDKAFDIGPAITTLGYAPRPFSDGVRDEIDRMRACGMLPVAC